MFISNVSQSSPSLSRQSGHSLSSPKFGVCPLCVAAVGTVAASSAASYAATSQVSGPQVAVATGVSTIAGSALGGLLFATHLLDPLGIGLLGSIAVGMLTSGVSTWAILSSQKPKNDSRPDTAKPKGVLA